MQITRKLIENFRKSQQCYFSFKDFLYHHFTISAVWFSLLWIYPYIWIWSMLTAFLIFPYSKIISIFFFLLLKTFLNFQYSFLKLITEPPNLPTIHKIICMKMVKNADNIFRMRIVYLYYLSWRRIIFIYTNGRASINDLQSWYGKIVHTKVHLL